MTISKLYETWLVHDHHDFEKLSYLCKSLRIRMPKVIITKLELPQHHIPEGYQVPSDAAGSLMDVIHCTEPKVAAAVMNQVIDGVQLLSSNWATSDLHNFW